MLFEHNADVKSMTMGSCIKAVPTMQRQRDRTQPGEMNRQGQTR